MTVPPRRVLAGDSMLVVEFEARIDLAVNARVMCLARRLAEAALPGVRDIVPTYCTVAIDFDPLRTDWEALSRSLDERLHEPFDEQAQEGSPTLIPVRYGGADGPDLADVARATGLSPAEVVERHTARDYHVFMMGFVPGFAYLGIVDDAIQVPRRSTPRTRVPAGSVAIAGLQTGVYPTETPGGWHVLGRTDVRMFDLARPAPFLLAPGAVVRFQAIEVSDPCAP